MVNVYTIWSTIIKTLKVALPQYTFIKANQAANLPDYPYVTVGITNSYIRDMDTLQGTIARSSVQGDATKVKLTKVTTPKMVFSIDCYSDLQKTALEILQEVTNYLTFAGLQDFRNNAIVIVDSDNVQDRTSFLEVDYQYRFGFDITIRVNDTVEMDVNSIDSVDV